MTAPSTSRVNTGIASKTTLSIVTMTDGRMGRGSAAAHGILEVMCEMRIAQDSRLIQTTRHLPPERDDVSAQVDGLRFLTFWTCWGIFALRLG